MSKTCYEIIPETKEYRWEKPDCILPLKSCGHKSFYGAWTPMFNVGLEKPFGIRLSFCPQCVRDASVAGILTDERWKRMKAVLKEHGEKIPSREKISMEWRMVEFPSTITYAMAA